MDSSAAPYWPATAAPVRARRVERRPKGTKNARGNTRDDDAHSTTDQHHRKS